jgi:hypothetical protein
VQPGYAATLADHVAQARARWQAQAGLAERLDIGRVAALQAVGRRQARPAAQALVGTPGSGERRLRQAVIGSLTPPMRQLVRTVAAACALLVTLATSISSASNPLPRLLVRDFGAFSVRPPHIIPSGDGSTIVAGPAVWLGRNPDPTHPISQFGHITWATWTASRATGSGVLWESNCKPNCADGTYYPRPTRLLASQVRNGAYTQLALVFGGHGINLLELIHVRSGGTGYVWEPADPRKQTRSR